MIFIYFFPFIGAFIGVLSTYLSSYMLFKSDFLKAVFLKTIENFHLEINLKNKFQEIDFKEDLDSLLDRHLSNLILNLKKQIPMGSLFLSGSFVEKLKTQAKEEILLMLPELKQKLLERIGKEADFDHLFSNIDLDNFEIDASSKNLLKKIVNRSAVASSALGFIVAGVFSLLAYLFI